MTAAMTALLPAEREEASWSGVEHARRFFMGEADVQRRGYTEKFPGSRGLRDTEELWQAAQAANGE
jgi:hypothetical protein